MMDNQILYKILSQPFPLSSEQKNAVFSTTRYTRVIAGAGAGKTETLTRRILYNLLIEEISPPCITAFTFTEKAAQSMKSRVSQRIKNLTNQNNFNNFSEMYIGTIHSFCLRILQDHYGYGNFNILDEN